MKRVFQTVPPSSSNSTVTSYISVKRMRLSRLAATLTVILLVSPSLAMSAWAQDLTVGTDESEYRPGDEVEIFGTAAAGSNISIAVNHSLSIIFESNATADEEGEYSDEFTLAEDAVAGNYTVTASLAGESAQTNFTVVDASQEDLAHELLNQVRKIRRKVERAFEELEEEDLEVPPEAEGNYTLGVDAATEAMEQMAAGNHSDAAEAAHRALQYFGDAYDAVQSLVSIEAKGKSGEGGDIDDDVEKAIGLYVAVDRAFLFIEKIVETADRLEEREYNVDLIRERLDDAYSSLTTLKGNLENDPIDTGDTARELARIRELIGQTMGLLHSTAAKEYKVEMAERFIEHVQSRIQGLDDKIDRLQGRIEAAKSQKARAALGRLLNKTEQMMLQLTEGDVDAIIEELDDVVDEIEDELEEINGEGMSSTLKAMDRIEARIRVLRATIERLERMGRNTTRVEEDLAAAEELLQEIMELLEEGDTEAAEELLEEVEGHIEDILDDIRKLHESGEDGGQGRNKDREGDDDDDEDEAVETEIIGEEPDELTEWIEELEDEIAHLDEKMANLSADGANVSAAEAMIQEAKELIAEARERADGEPGAAEDLLDEAEERVEEAEDLLEELEEAEGSESDTSADTEGTEEEEEPEEEGTG